MYRALYTLSMTITQNTKNTKTTDTLYTEVSGTTAYINNERGTVTALRSMNGRKVGAFIHLDERNATIYAELGAPVGDRNAWHEVATAGEIDRDEFDRMNDMDEIRKALGWR